MTVRYITNDSDGVVAIADDDLWIMRESAVLSNAGTAFSFGSFARNRLIVSGSIISSNDAVSGQGADFSIYVMRTGSIYGVSDGIEVNLGAQIVNDGEVHGEGDAAVQIFNGSGGSITNNGVATGFRGLVYNGSSGQIVNTGTVIAQGAVGIYAEGADVFNSGTVQAPIWGVQQSMENTLRNTGTISGDTASYQGGVSVQTVFNSGLMIGDVILGEENDRYNGIGGRVAGTIFGGEGHDTLVGGDSVDHIDGGEGNDRIEGGGGDDSLSGVAGHDVIVGGAGDDTLSGHTGNDTLRGGDGNDALYAGHHRDLLFGGNGDDAFVFLNTAESENNANADVIRDFERGEDIIDLEAVSAQEMGFTGAAGHTGGGTASVRVVVNALGTAAVLVDADGNGTSDMRILVSGQPNGLTAGDFVL